VSLLKRIEKGNQQGGGQPPAGSGVATRLADCPGLVVLPGDRPKPWAAAIIELAAAPRRRAVMAQAARAYVEARVPSWSEVLTEDLLPVWQAAAGRRNG
jgi:hypothetical protein